MVKLIPALHRQRYAEADVIIKDALERVFQTRTGRPAHRALFGMRILGSIHERLFEGGDTELATFVLHVAPQIRAIAMHAVERQAVIEPVRLKLIDFEQWLRRLDELDSECVRIIELRYFAGLTVREAAAVLDLPVAEVLGQLRFAKAWLQARVRWSTRSAP
jgi:DNA-directed RNA polymerase specialized sigma24 family protein